MKPLSKALFACCLGALAGCPASPPPGPPPEWLPRVPDGLGRPWDAQVVLGVKDRRLRLPTGETCLAEEPACAAALEALQGKRLALELDASLKMAELSAALSALTTALGDRGLACLAVADSKGRRCVPFRPFSGDDFGTWLDADKPLGKLRVVMRSDGLEVVTDRGKILGQDRHGPSLPSVGATPDWAGLEDASVKLSRRFPDEDTAGLVPSPGIPVSQAAKTLAILNGPDGDRFPKTFLVYP